MAATYPCGQPGSSSFASHWRFLPRRLDGTTAGCQFILPLLHVPLRPKGCLHTCRFRPLRARRRLLTACLGDPIPLAIPCAVSRDQIHHRLRFCCDSFFTCIFLRSFRHHFNTIGGTEMADVEQTQKMIPFITCEISLCQYVCELVLVSLYLIWIWGFKLILSHNQSRATLWVLETCLLIGGLLHFMIILIPASLSSKITTKLPDEKNARLRK